MTDKAQTTTAAAPEAAKTEETHVTVQLSAPLLRGSAKIAEVTLRKPLTGELTGLKLFELLNLEVESVTKLLLRISSPGLLAHEVKKLDPADFAELCGAVAGFFNKKTTHEEYPSA